MLGGYMGKVLRIDLTRGEISVQTFSEETLRKFIGGCGLGAKILFEETSVSTDPLGPENVLIFMTGPLTCTPLTGFGRHQVICKSPLTNRYGEANSGGRWGACLKKAGFDGIVVKGKSSQPVYLWIHNGQCEIRDAHPFWNKDTYEIDQLIKRETDPDAVIASIGQAGERLVRIAGIINDGVDGRASARCGVGAVMGSKNLKCIAVSGSNGPELFDKERLMASLKEKAKSIKSNTEGLGKYGTSGGLVTVEWIGDLPVQNWRAGRFAEGAKKINGVKMAETILAGRYHCYNCVVGCGRTIKVENGPYECVKGGGPEYETIGMLGSNCLIDNLEAIAKANELCNRYGLDTISTGSSIAFAMELYERGLINKEHTGGIELTWGSADAMIAMVKKIAFREDIGWLLGEGTKRAGEAIGGIAEEVAVNVKGLDFPAHDPRAKYSNALAFATSERGACHLNAFSYEFEQGATMDELGYPETLDRFTLDGKAEFVAKFQNLMAIFDSLVGCKFLVFGLGDTTISTLADWLNAVTGWSFSVEDLLATGERIVNLKRLYNCGCGASRKDDNLPLRILTHPRGEGGASDTLPHLGKMLNEYYQYRGWDEFGMPSSATIQKLGLSNLAT